MNRLIPFLLLVLCACACGNSQSAGKLTKFPPPETVTLKNEAGEIISLETLRSLEEMNPFQMTASLLVIQHSNRKYRKKYLPYLREAVQRGDLELANLAVLED